MIEVENLSKRYGEKLAVDGLPLYDRSILIRTPALGQELVAAMGTAPVCLMRGHGITTAANSIEEAALHAIHLNDLATMNYRAHVLGDERPTLGRPEPVGGRDRGGD